MVAMNDPRVPGSRHLFTGLCWLQGAYYFVTGIWPLVSIRIFKAVTGEKGKSDNLATGLDIDYWLIMTVSVLIMAIAITLLIAAYRKTQFVELAILAIAAAVGLTAIDVIYTIRGVIMPVYLLDAALEVPLVLAWLFVMARGPELPRNNQPQAGFR
jgi:hypothetical protein